MGSSLSINRTSLPSAGGISCGLWPNEPNASSRRKLAAEDLGDHLAERVDVGPSIDHPFALLLGRHVRRRSDPREAILRTSNQSDAEIDQHGRRSPAQYDIVGLHVAMHDSLGMKRGERIGDTGEKAEQLLVRRPCA